MRRSRFVLVTLPLLAAATMLSSCKSPTSPLAQDGAPPDTIPGTTPAQLVLQQVVLRKFPAKTTSGGDWDPSPFPESRKPDIYLVIQREGYLPVYSSDIRENATAGNIYRFTTGYGTPDLPLYVAYGSDLRVYVMDRDVGGDPDRIGWITLDLPAARRSDGSATVDHVYRDSADRIEIEIVGVWSYAN